ncbi:hypothetical protein AAE02nite_32170 [Adhaeribacter aerolatus]|uniref:DUF1819 domain-containing protein n=2 Tax=Adhaeribacter aerolatus TaxID=670289 RepID=A0A512B0R1_9BACT|nr:hypothetical protein AAE02nite_32170 [Adhaeribacter aerolatus]
MGGALLFNEFRAVLPLLKEPSFKELLEKEVKENLLLKINAQASRARIANELRNRAGSVDREFWFYFEGLEEKEQRLALYYIILKTYPLLLNFHFEVVLKKWRTLDYHLEKFDLQMRLDEIVSQDATVAGWTDNSRNKIISVFMTMLKDAGFLSRNQLRKPENISSSFWKFFVTAGDLWFLEACFVNKTEREAYL